MLLQRNGECSSWDINYVHFKLKSKITNHIPKWRHQLTVPATVHGNAHFPSPFLMEYFFSKHLVCLGGIWEDTTAFVIFFQWVLLSPEVTFKYKDIRIDRNEMDFLLSNLQSANAGPLCTRHDVVTVWMTLYIFFGIFYDRFFWISSEIGDNSWSLEDRFLAFEDKSHLDPNLANDTRDWTLTTEMPRLWLEGWLLVRTQSYHFKAWFQLGNTNWSHSLHAIWVRWNSGEKKP